MQPFLSVSGQSVKAPSPSAIAYPSSESDLTMTLFHYDRKSYWPIFRAGARTQEHRSREMKRLSYSKNTDLDSNESKQREAGLPSEPPETPRISVIPHPHLLKAVPPSPLEMLIPSVELD